MPHGDGVGVPVSAYPTGTCRVCSCTDAEGCAYGCGWVDEEHTLCSVCYEQGPYATHSRQLYDALAALAAFEDPELRRHAQRHARKILAAVRRDLRDAGRPVPRSARRTS